MYATDILQRSLSGLFQIRINARFFAKFFQKKSEKLTGNEIFGAAQRGLTGAHYRGLIRDLPTPKYNICIAHNLNKICHFSLHRIRKNSIQV